MVSCSPAGTGLALPQPSCWSQLLIRLVPLDVCDEANAVRISSFQFVNSSMRTGADFDHHSTFGCWNALFPFLSLFFQVSESAYRRDPVSKVSLLTLDMEKSIDFYQDVRGTIVSSPFVVQC